MDSTDKYGVFIIESLTLEDEETGKTDGEILQTVLDICEIENRYFYIRTSHELEEIVKEFQKSEYRYLHLSCHASSEEIAFTFESLYFHEVADILNPYLAGKRIFLSACSAANIEFAKTLVSTSKSYSLIGSPEPIRFDKSAVFWSSYYHLMFNQNERRMGQPEMKRAIQKLVNLFEVSRATKITTC